MINVVILGATGSGKGTQGRLLSEKYSLKHISIGQLFRDAIERGTELGRKAKVYVESGRLVPDSIAVPLIVEQLQQLGTSNSFVLDGFPRNIDQAVRLTSSLEQVKMHLTVVINLVLSKEEIINRNLARRICSNCGKEYNLISSPPRLQGACDECGGTLVERVDDKPDTIERRVQSHLENNDKIVQYYGSLGILKDIDASGDITEVFQRIDRAVGEKVGKAAQ